MYRIKKLSVLALIFLLSGCYEAEITIELNPDGSGILKRSLNFNRASEQQKVQIREFMNDKNANFGTEFLEIKETFQEPYFKITKHEIDKDNLSTYSEIQFQDINRLFALDKEDSGLKGISFEVDKSNITFYIKKNTESKAEDSPPSASNPLSKLSAKATYRFISKSNNEMIESVHEFVGDGNNLVIDWQGKLNIPNHTITKKKIKQTFANYPVLATAGSKYKTATWLVQNDKSKNSLELELLVPKPLNKGKTYLGYDKTFVVSGSYSDGTEVSVFKKQYVSSDKFNSFSDSFVKEGGGNFKLPVNLSFPHNPVDFLDSLIVKIRVLSIKNTKTFELGKPLNGKTIDADSFKFFVEHKGKTIDISHDGPAHLFKQYLIKTPSGNIFPHKPTFMLTKTTQFKNIPIIHESTVLAEYYTGSEYVWLDVKAPKLSFTEQGNEQPAGQTLQTFSLENLFPEIKSFPVVDDSIYKDLDSFKNYWSALPDNQVIPALLVVSNSMDKFKKTWEIYSWYQGKLGQSIKERGGFFESNKDTLGDYMFRLFLSKPNQNDNTAILYMLTNLGLTDTFKQKAVTAIKQGKFKKGIGIIFRGDISTEDKKLLKALFYSTAHDWTENQSIFKVLTKGDSPDLALAREVLSSDQYHEFVRQSALEALLDKDKTISSEDIKPFIINPETRRSAIRIIKSRLDKYHSRGEITKEEMITVISPLMPVFEDLVQLVDDFDIKDLQIITDAIDSASLQKVNQ